MRIELRIEESLDGCIRALKNIIQALTNRLTFADNIQSTITTVTFNVTPNTAQSIPHSLERTPVMFTYYADRSCNVYASGTAWSATSINLKCDTASAVVTLLIF